MVSVHTLVNQLAPTPKQPLAEKLTAFETLDSIELNEDSELTLRQVRESITDGSLMADYLDDFLPGEKNEYLDATLSKREDGNWVLRIWVDTADEEGVLIFTSTGAWVGWGN